MNERSRLQSLPENLETGLLLVERGNLLRNGEGYLAAISPGRQQPDKHQDIADFIRGYKENVDRIDHGLLIDLASRAHSKAHEEFPEFLDAVENDRPVML